VLELDGEDLRRQPIEKRKELLADLLRGSRLSIVLNEQVKVKNPKAPVVTREAEEDWGG
jgi:ATP-dependent DNA ligase